MKATAAFATSLLLAASVPSSAAPEGISPFEQLLAAPVRLRPELANVHPRVFVTREELRSLRERARTTHRERWQTVLATLPALASDPPGNDEILDVRRAQNNVAHAIAGVSLAYAVEGEPKYLAAARKWTLAAIGYEPWGYTFSKPNVDLAAGHLLYAVGWAYDLLYDEWTPAERARIRRALERHARLVYQRFSPAADDPSARKPKRFQFTQNHDFIPTAGLAVAALALIGESEDAERWAALARAHNLRALQLLSPDGCYYEGFEYWIFAAPWLVHFATAWEHSTGESLWSAPPFSNWKHYVAHTLLPDGRAVFDFGDVWEGPLTRAGKGTEYARLYPNGVLQSNFNVLWQVAARLRDGQTQAVADRLAAFGHTNLEEYWTLVYRDASLPPSPMEEIPLGHHCEDSGVYFSRTSWQADATAFAFKAGPPEGHRVGWLLPEIPEWELESGHAHPDACSFVIWAKGRYLLGDTGYAGQPAARDHNTITVDGVGQGRETRHDVWSETPYADLDAVRIREVRASPGAVRLSAECAAAYGPETGLRRFTRSFSFQAPLQFEVSDTIELAAPKPVQWFLHADQPFTADGRRFELRAGDVTLAGEIEMPAGARITTRPVFVVSPGRPGSIEQGPKDPRGHVLEVALEPAARASLRTRIRVR